MSSVSSVREKVLDAAIDLLGTQGLRSLTHARVDARAGVATGSTSNYFRTRAALLVGVVEWIYEEERPVIDAAYAPGSTAELAVALTELFAYMTGPHREMTMARLVLLVEASHDASVSNALAKGRSMMEQTVVPAVERLGAVHPQLAAQALSACFEGLFLQKLARHVDVDAGIILARVVHAFIEPDSAVRP